MSVAFELPVAPSWIVRAGLLLSHLAGATGVATAGWLLDDRFPQTQPFPLLVGALVAVSIVLAGLVRLRRLPVGRLSVDERGRALWRPAIGAPSAAAPSEVAGPAPLPARAAAIASEPAGEPCRIERFYIDGRLAWLHARLPQRAPTDPRWWRTVGRRPDRLMLLVGRDAAGADDWRSLRAWLQWAERGRS